MGKENDTKSKRIPKTMIEKIKSRIDIVDFVSSKQEMKLQGENYHSNCPICKSKTSFVVYPKSQSFYCFACSNGGDIITYVMRTEDREYVEAVQELASLADIDTVENNSVEISNLMRDAAFYYHSQLRDNPKAKSAIDLLHSWGIQGKTIVQLGIGFHDDSFNGFIGYMTKQKSYSFEALERAKLVLKSSKGTLFDKMRNSIIIPTIDKDGKVVCFDFYVLDKEQNFKYPNTDFFRRSENLYSYNLAIKPGKQSVIIVSSYEDYFRLVGKGITNVVSTYLPKITEQQMVLLKKKFKVVMLLTHQYANVPMLKVFCNKNNMYCEQFDVDADKTVAEFIDINASKIKERVDYFESIFNK